MLDILLLLLCLGPEMTLKSLASSFLKQNFLFVYIFKLCNYVFRDYWVHLSYFWRFLYYNFSFCYTSWVHICINTVKWWNEEIIIRWNVYLVGWLEYVNVVLWWNGAMSFFVFPIVKWRINIFFTYGEMVKSLYGVMVIWLNGRMVNSLLGDTFT